jgi:hypothetical protein
MKIYITNSTGIINTLEYQGQLTTKRRNRIKELFSNCFSKIEGQNINVIFEDEDFLYGYKEAEIALGKEV